jgi:hypothetical protein
MQELYDDLIKKKYNQSTDVGFREGLDFVFDAIKQDYLEKEKEVMCGIYDDAIAQFDPTYTGQEKHGEQYYNETFNTKEI